jgi:hypothetical protein
MQRDRLSGPLHGVDGPSLSWGLCLTPASGGEALHLSHPQVIKTCGLNLASLAERPLRENGSPLPPVVGFPHRCVLCSIRLPIRIRRAFPLTVLLRLPAPLTTSPLRFQHCSVSGFPLLCLKSCIPYPVASPVQELLGSPKFFNVSLPACHGLRTPADLSILAHNGWSCVAFGVR